MTRRQKLKLAIGCVALVACVFWRSVTTWSLVGLTIWLDIQQGMLYSETRSPGYAISMYGGYEHVFTRDLDIWALNRLTVLQPEDPHHRYRLGGALIRCLALPEAETVLAPLAADSQIAMPGSYLLLSMMHWVGGDPVASQVALDKYNAAHAGVRLPKLVAQTAFANLPVAGPNDMSQPTAAGQFGSYACPLPAAD